MQHARLLAAGGVVLAGLALGAKMASATPAFDVAKLEYISAKSAIASTGDDVDTCCVRRTQYNEKLSAMTAAASMPDEINYANLESQWAAGYSCQIDRLTSPLISTHRVWLSGPPVQVNVDGSLSVMSGSGWGPYVAPTALTSLISCSCVMR